MAGEIEAVQAVASAANANKNNNNGGSFVKEAGLRVLDAAIAKEQMWTQDQYNIKAEDRANKEWERRFNMENEYNTPAMQSQRLKEAGINPLGALSGSAPTPSSTGSTNSSGTSTPQAEMPSFAGLAIAMQQLKMQEQQVVNDTNVSIAQADKAQAEADAVRASIPQKDRQLGIEEREVSVKEAMLPHNIQKVAAEVRELDARTNYTNL